MQNAGDIKRELTWALKGNGATQAVVTGATRRGSYLGWVLSAALAIALAATVPSGLRNWLSVTPVPSAVRLSVSPSDNTTFIGSGASVPTTQFAVSPDGRQLAFIAAAIGGRPMVWVRSLDTLEARVLPGTEDAAYPFWSPDSRFLGFLAQGKLKKTDLLGGLPQALCDASSSDPRGASWNRDGIILFAPSSASGLLQVSAGGGSPTMALPLHDGDMSYRWPSFLPDGRHFLFYARGTNERRGVYVGSLGSTTTTRVLDTGFDGPVCVRLSPHGARRVAARVPIRRKAAATHRRPAESRRERRRDEHAAGRVLPLSRCPRALTGPHYFQPADVVRP